MRIEAKRQQSKSPHERGVRHPLGLMEPIVGALFEPRSGHTATHERPAEESRSIHDQLDEPHSPSDRLHHCLCTFCRWRFFVPMKCREEEKRKKEKKKRIKQSNVRKQLDHCDVHPRSVGRASFQLFTSPHLERFFRWTLLFDPIEPDYPRILTTEITRNLNSVSATRLFCPNARYSRKPIIKQSRCNTYPCRAEHSWIKSVFPFSFFGWIEHFLLIRV